MDSAVDKNWLRRSAEPVVLALICDHFYTLQLLWIQLLDLRHVATLVRLESRADSAGVEMFSRPVMD